MFGISFSSSNKSLFTLSRKGTLDAESSVEFAVFDHGASFVKILRPARSSTGLNNG